MLFASLARAGVRLDFMGATGCTALIDTTPGAFLFSLGVSSPFGVQIPLPDSPLFTGDLYSQLAYAAPGLNAANLGTTTGLRTQVR